MGELTVRRGKIHDYLGMTLDFLSKGKFIINMEAYLDEVLGDLPKDMDGMVSTPAADYIFKTQDNVVKLDIEKADSAVGNNDEIGRASLFPTWT